MTSRHGCRLLKEWLKGEGSLREEARSRKGRIGCIWSTLAILSCLKKVAQPCSGPAPVPVRHVMSSKPYRLLTCGHHAQNAYLIWCNVTGLFFTMQSRETYSTALTCVIESVYHTVRYWHPVDGCLNIILPPECFCMWLYRALLVPAERFSSLASEIQIFSS